MKDVQSYMHEAPGLHTPPLYILINVKLSAHAQATRLDTSHKCLCKLLQIRPLTMSHLVP